jgi:hypothetical protein
MNPLVLKDPGLYPLLVAIDEELAAETRALGCKHCGSKLHEGGFPRKPRGCPARVQAVFAWRTSYDCSSCRGRTMPPSVRFLHRRVYVATVFALVSPRGNASTSWLSKQLQVPVRTVDRWRRWWREDFARTPLWQALRGQFLPPPEAQTLPAGLLERLRGVSPAQRLTRLLRLLVPLSP